MGSIILIAIVCAIVINLFTDKNYIPYSDDGSCPKCGCSCGNKVSFGEKDFVDAILPCRVSECKCAKCGYSFYIKSIDE